jgi:hypothetical protein
LDDDDLFHWWCIMQKQEADCSASLIQPAGSINSGSHPIRCTNKKASLGKRGFAVFR